MHQMASWTIGRKGKTFLSKQYCVYITKINILKVFFKISNQNFYKFRKFCKCQYTWYFHTFTIFLINCFHSSTNVLWYRIAHKKLKIVFVNLLVFFSWNYQQRIGFLWWQQLQIRGLNVFNFLHFLLVPRHFETRETPLQAIAF